MIERVQVWIVKRAAWMLLVSAMLALLSPCMLVLFRPWRDVAYHLGPSSLVVTEGDGSFVPSADLHVEVAGRVRPDRMVERGYFTTTGYLFQLDGYPDELLVWVPSSGQTFDAMTADADASTHVVVRGRLYRGDGLAPFMDYAGDDDVEAGEFVDEWYGEPLGPDWYLLVADEHPAWTNLVNTRVAFFICGPGPFVLLIVVGFAMGWHRDPRQQQLVDGGLVMRESGVEPTRGETAVARRHGT